MIIEKKVFSGIFIAYMNTEYLKCHSRFCLFEYSTISRSLRLKLVICYKVYKEPEIQNINLFLNGHGHDFFFQISFSTVITYNALEIHF